MARNTLIQSYVCDKFFVSTIYRRSSAMESPGCYYETMAWRWGKTTKERGEMVDQGAAGSIVSAYQNHFEMCKKLNDFDEDKIGKELLEFDL